MSSGIIANGVATSGTPTPISYTPSSNGKVSVTLQYYTNGNYFSVNGTQIWSGGTGYYNFTFYVQGGTTYTFTPYYVYYLISAIEETS